jgi:hypothetical protein
VPFTVKLLSCCTLSYSGFVNECHIAMDVRGSELKNMFQCGECVFSPLFSDPLIVFISSFMLLFAERIRYTLGFPQFWRMKTLGLQRT